MDLEISTASDSGDRIDQGKFRILSGEKQTRQWVYSLKRDAAFMEWGNRPRVEFRIAGNPIKIPKEDRSRQMFTVVFSATGRTLRSGSLTFSYPNATDISEIRRNVRIVSAFVSTMPVDIYIDETGKDEISPPANRR